MPSIQYTKQQRLAKCNCNLQDGGNVTEKKCLKINTDGDDVMKENCNLDMCEKKGINSVYNLQSMNLRVKTALLTERVDMNVEPEQKFFNSTYR